MNKNMKKLAFTLAEVLLTLVIIGVVAAMSIPILYNTTERREFISGAKKANSVVKQALLDIQRNNGYAGGDYLYLLENTVFADEFKKVVSNIHSCDNENACKELYVTGKKSLNNDTTIETWGRPNAKGITTSDGMQYYIWTNYMQFGLSDEDFANINQNGSIAIAVDINGTRKPNKFGLDCFLFILIDRKGILPAGASDDSDCNRKDLGFTCTSKVLRENKITY